MCIDPVTLGWVATAVSAGGSIMAGNAQAQANNAQAAMYDQQAKISDAQAISVNDKQASDEKKLRQQGLALQATQRTAAAASGIDSNSGSALDILGDTSMGIANDAATLRYNADMDKWGYGAQATNYRNAAGMSRAEAKNAKLAGTIGALTTVLSGASTIANKTKKTP